MCAAYPYRPLSPSRKEIRLLRFESTSHQSTSEHVRCTIEHISLDDNHPISYHAISYSWGANPKFTTMILDGSEIRMPESAVEALRGTCSSAHNRSTLVWIDAICINQQDLDEKSEQVAFMGEIYSRAEQVLIWLGNDDGSTVGARKILLKLAGECLQMTNNGREMEAHLRSKLDPEHPPVYTLMPPPDGCDWHAFFDFFAVSWFSRLWILQEVILSRKATCFRGDVVLSWHTVKVAVRWLAHRLGFNPQMQNTILYNITNTAGSIGWVNVSWLVNVQGFDWPEMPLEVLLHAAAPRQVTEPRDKIYGLLGLIRGSLRQSPDVQTLLQPDYRRPIKDLYTEASWLALKTGESLGLLYSSKVMLSKVSRNSNLPTWVPPLDAPLDVDLSTIASRDLHFHASHDLTPTFSRDEQNPDILRVQGTIVDEISSRHIAFTGGDPSENVNRIVAGNIEYVVNLIVSGDFPGPPGFLKAVASTIVAGVYGETSDAEEASQLVPDFCAFALACLQTANLWPKNPLRVLSKERIWAVVNQLQAQVAAGKGDKTAFENATVLNPGSRAYVRTAGGRVGAVSKAVKKGDVVCIFHGADLPLVLRRKGSYWQLVETAYVYGIMKGEYIRELRDSGQLEAETVMFKIC